MTAVAVTAEELELQEQVTHALERQGVLGKIKAQLRAAVFQTIHSAGAATNGRDAFSGRGSQSSVVPSTAMLQGLGTDAPVALELVRNFLECLELDHTLAVFLAESGMDGNALGPETTEWRMPARLCERVGVPPADETVPVLVKLLRVERRTSGGDNKSVFGERDAESAADVVRSKTTHESGLSRNVDERLHSELPRKQPLASTLDLPPPPAKMTPQTTPPMTQQRVDEDDGELEGSMAEEIASGSFEEESLAESASVDQSQSEEVRTNVDTGQPAVRPGRFGAQHDDADDEEEPSPSIASPPPVPAKLGPLPSLPGTGIPNSEPLHDASDDEEDAKHTDIPDPDDDEDEDLDDDAAAARLRSLEEKLKEMEAEDDTGMLQQLKETALHDTEDPEPTNITHGNAKMVHAKTADANDDEGDDNYGSDFEEEVDEEDEEVASEMSEDIASVSMLSESEDAMAKPTVETDPLAHDKPVANEDALNSYDYIEAVERDHF